MNTDDSLHMTINIMSQNLADNRSRLQSEDGVWYLLTDIMFSICSAPLRARRERTSKIPSMLYLFWACRWDSTSNVVLFFSFSLSLYFFSFFFGASRHYSNNVLVMIYIWGTVMVDITKQNWQNIPIVLQKGRLSPTLTLCAALKRLWCRACTKKK